MPIVKEITVTFVCEASDNRHDFIKGEGTSQYEVESMREARKLAQDDGWILFVKGPPESRAACFCPECVKRWESKANQRS